MKSGLNAVSYKAILSSSQSTHRVSLSREKVPSNEGVIHQASKLHIPGGVDRQRHRAYNSVLGDRDCDISGGRHFCNV